MQYLEVIAYPPSDQSRAFTRLPSLGADGQPTWLTIGSNAIIAVTAIRDDQAHVVCLRNDCAQGGTTTPFPVGEGAVVPVRCLNLLRNWAASQYRAYHSRLRPHQHN
jgi:hypothetical protein